MNTGEAELFDLRRERLNRGLSLRQAGEEIGVAPNSLNRIEQGHVPTPATAKKVADFFGVKVTDMIPIEAAA